MNYEVETIFPITITVGTNQIEANNIGTNQIEANNIGTNQIGVNNIRTSQIVTNTPGNGVSTGLPIKKSPILAISIYQMYVVLCATFCRIFFTMPHICLLGE